MSHICTDKSRLDLTFIHDYPGNRSYWAKGRTMGIIERSIANSPCFGVFDKFDKDNNR